jgi:riboflavin biosynthesis pyrimidine reductase
VADSAEDAGEPSPSFRLVIGPRPGPVDFADLGAAYPWPGEGRWVRALMVSTLDGGTVGPDGRSRSISSVSDRTVFSAVRRTSDVVLIGAGTFRAERYRPMLARADDAHSRAAAGQAPAPVVTIVSGTLDLPWDEPIFAESAVRPILVTTESADPSRLAEARRHADVLALPGARLDLGAMVDELVGRGLRRIVCEGGARLLATISQDGLLDEVDLTVSPLMSRGGQVSTGTASSVPQHFSLTQVIAADDGFLFNRYISERPR